MVDCTTRFSGSALLIQWVHPGGTITLSGNQRTFTYSPTINNIDATAGNDEYTLRVNGVKDWGGNVSLLPPGDEYIAIENALVQGTFGTLIVGPQGTASGLRKYTLPAKSNGANVSFPYNDIVEMSNDFEACGTPTLATY